MAQPQAYDRTVDFTQRDGDDTDHPALNQELDAAALSINGIRNNLALIQNDDGGLKNAVVTADSLAPDAFDAVLVNVNVAVGEAETAAQSAITSATTANIARDQAVAAAAAAQTSQTASALNANTASTAAGVATAQAVIATTQAGIATTQAGIATTKAGEADADALAAAASAATATTQAGNASTSAATATTQAGIATTGAATATTQAGIATTGASTATTQAGIATTKAVEAATSAATVNLPTSLVGKLLNFLRVKADESGYEHRTAVQVRSDIGAAAAADIGKNKLINGNLSISQRGYVSGAATTAGQYTLDRWKVTGVGGITFATVNNITTVTIPVGQTLQQVIEGANLQSGTNVLSWSGTAQGRINGGVYGASGAVTAMATGGTNMTVEFGPGTVSLAQLEAGSLASAFEQRLISVELAQCQRYYEKSYAQGVAPGTATSAGAVSGQTNVSNIANICVRFGTTKTGTPTITVYGTDGTAGVVTDNANRAATVVNPGMSGFSISFAGNTGFFGYAHYVASAEL